MGGAVAKGLLVLATAPLKSPQTSRAVGLARTQSMSRHNYSVSPRLSALSEPRRKSTSYDHPIAATRAKFLNPGDAEDDDPLFGQDDDGTKSYVTHQSTGAGAVLGVPLLAVGKHTFVYEIINANRDGYGILLGVADADPSSSPKKQRVWAYSPYDNSLKAVARIGETWEVFKPLGRGIRGQPHSHPQAPRLRGAKVLVIVDMDAKRLAFAINNGAPVDAGVVLPDVVRPCVTLASPGDAISLHSVKHRPQTRGEEVEGSRTGPLVPPVRFLSRAEDSALLFESVRAARHQLYASARQAADERIRQVEIATADAMTAEIAAVEARARKRWRRRGRRRRRQCGRACT